MIEYLKIPRHVGIILDGNGRWATKRGLSRSMGHAAGFKNLKKTAVHILKTGTEVLSVYAFSTENFKRSKEEVDYLMNLFASKFRREIPYFNKHNVKVVFSGRRKAPLPKEVIESMNEMESSTKNNTGGIFNICINYGGHAEIVDAVKKISRKINNGKLKTDDINEEMLYKYMYNNLPPIDFLIRTSGESRVSNFMLYQLSYAEFYFPQVHFPDFTNEEYDKALNEFNKRDRRFGGIKK